MYISSLAFTVCLPTKLQSDSIESIQSTLEQAEKKQEVEKELEKIIRFNAGLSDQ